MKTIGHFLNNELVDGGSGRSLDVTDPSTGAPVRSVALASADETRTAIAQAQAAFPAWAALPAFTRARILFRFKELLERNSDEIARLISEEHGKIFSDAKGEVVRGLEVVEFACGIPHLLKGAVSPDVGRGIDCHHVYAPLGVCAGITPFNFPVMVPLWMVPVALACGNSFVLKPSERDPSSPMYLAELLMEAGLPPGVLQVVNGDKEAVDVLLTDDRIKAVGFIGSTPVARHVYSTAANNGKRVQALGGAKNHLVVMPDADLDQVENALIGAAYGAAGERCMAISVAVVVGDDTANALVPRLAERVSALRVGPGLNAEPENEMGPVITAEHRQRIIDLIATGAAEGAELVVDGRDFVHPERPDGFFLGGTLFDHVKQGMQIWQEEVFGPVLCVVRVPDLGSALDVVNSHRYGNGTAIFTRDGDAARRFSGAVEAGMVGINIPIPVPVAFHSFGGWKESLFGVQHMYGPEGIRFFTRMKTMTTRWPDPAKDASEFAMPTMK